MYHITSVTTFGNYPNFGKKFTIFLWRNFVRILERFLLLDKLTVLEIAKNWEKI